MKWETININRNQINVETSKSVLIKCPNNSKYSGYEFWHPSKLVRDGKNSYSVTVSFTNEFEFKLIKYGKGKYNKQQVINEITINAEELKEVFGITDENITSKKEKSYLKVKEPKPLEVNVEVLEEFKNEI